MTRLVTPEFREEQGYGRYPFEDTATLTAEDGVTVLAKDSFADASLYPIDCEYPLYVRLIVVTADTVTITITDDRDKDVCFAQLDIRDPTEALRCYDSYNRAAGALVLGEQGLAQLPALPVGTYTFRSTATQFVASCVIPTPEIGVRGILLESGEIFTGDVWIVGDNGVVVRQGDTSDDVRIDIVGDPLFVRELCEQVELFTPPLFVQTINGCPPDNHGNFQLVVGDSLAADTVLRVYADDNDLIVEAAGAAKLNTS